MQWLLRITVLLLCPGVTISFCVPDARPDLDLPDYDDYDSPIGYAEDKLRRLKGKCKKSKDRRFIPLKRGDGVIDVDCGTCRVFSVNVRGWDPKESCWGLNHDMLVDKLNCTWKHQCRLTSRSRWITWVMDQANLDCLGEDVHHLDLAYSCLNKDVSISDVMVSREWEHVKGIVRSHEQGKMQPTNYPVNQMYQKRHRQVIHAPLLSKRPTGNPQDIRVIVYVMSMDVAKEDKLTLSHPSGSCHRSEWTVGDIYGLQASSLIVDFDVRPGSRAGKGFQLCFQWMLASSDSLESASEKTIAFCNKSAEELPVISMLDIPTTQSYSGIVRSHRTSPWNYPRPVDMTGTHVTHFLELRSPKGRLKRLHVWVYTLNLGHGDTLMFNDKDVKKDLRDGNQETLQLEGDLVTLNFSVYNSRQMATGEGFLFCYSWQAINETVNSDSDPCRRYVYQASICKRRAKQVIPSECRKNTKTPKRPKKHKKKDKKKTAKKKESKKTSRKTKKKSKKSRKS